MLLLLIQGRPVEEICPNATDHPGHRLIYMGPTCPGLFTI